MKPRPFWAALVLGACLLATVHFLFRPDQPQQTPPVPALVTAGDQEIAFLNPATTGTAWERLIAGLHFLTTQNRAGQLEVDDSQAYPRATVALPAVALRRKGQAGTLWIRWYKLTGQNSIPVWLEALTRRQPPPLAVLGGGSSDRAKELAERLQTLRQEGRETPVLLLTTATAEYVAPIPDNPPPLMRIYDQRTFRFCFSNRQMARATLDFLWSQKLLPTRPGLICFLSWKDDPFTQDLTYQFRELLGERFGEVLLNIEIPYSIGPLLEPNAGEQRAVRKLLEELRQIPADKPVLLVMPGGAVPVRRVLRDLFRTAPGEAQRIVVAVGDAIDFNTVVRDRTLSWQIQDVPCPLVLFCHRHPMCGQTDAVWWKPTPETTEPAARCSTQDLLLYADIGHALATAVFKEDGLLAQPSQLAQVLPQVQDARGQPVFQNEPAGSPPEPESLTGNRRYEGAKYIVLLRPLREAGQILPLADLQLFLQGTGGWQQRGALRLTYGNGAAAFGEGTTP
jgi:hypothetical protein